MAKKVFALIDGKSVFYRGYYAMPMLSTKDGTPTGGVYGFVSLALEMVRRIKPDYVAVAWDKPHTNIRRRLAIYDQYKAGRKPAPPDFYQQIPILEDLLKAFGWPMYQMDDYEADDIIGTLSEQANAIGIHTIMISSDLDMLQLIDNDTELYALKKGLSNLEKFDRAAFEAKYGIEVSQFLDLKSLKGDASDNIPGVAGIGEKTAISLLQQFGTLDNIYSHLDEVTKPAVRAKLEAGRASAYMSKELGKIWTDAPLKLDLAAVDVNNLDRHALRQKLLDLEFTSLVRRLPDNLRENVAGVSNSAAALTTDVAGIASADGPTEFTALEPVAVKPLDDAGRAQLGKSAQIVVVIDDGLLLSSNNEAAYQVNYREATDLLAGKLVITHDAKALARELLMRNLEIKYQVEFDTKHAAFLLNSLVKAKDLNELLASEAEIITPGLKVAKVWNLYNREHEALSSETKLKQLASQVDFPLQTVLARMETRGVYIDVAALNDMSTKLADEVGALEQQIWQLVGYEFNISSPAQLSEALFTKLGLPISAKRNKSGNYPTGQKELDKLLGAHPVIELIERYRELTKLKSTYVDALPRQVGPDGRIHTTLDQDVTATGRLSSSNPNLQNIPTRSERGREIKRAFAATPGKVLVNADYAQFELRLAAALAGDQKMIEMFQDDTVDIHTMTAAEAYGISPDQVTPDQRRHAKVINFGVLYGMSPHGLANATDMDYYSAKAFIDRYFELRKPIREFLDSTLKQADEKGYVETLFGRRRSTPDVRSSNYMVRESAKRAAANMPIQGTEADLMKMAMLRVEAEIPAASQIMQVHDSIMVECDPADADTVSRQMVEIMENIYPAIGVRLKVEAAAGSSWAAV